MTEPAGERVRVLLVDDDEDDSLLTRDLLREIAHSRFEVDWEGSYETGMERLVRGAHDVCLVDYRLGARDGVEFLQEAASRQATTPLILLTGQGDHDTDLAAMNAGAADFLDKGRLTADVLDRSIRYAVQHRRIEESRLRLVTERAARTQAELAAAAAREHAGDLEREVRERRRVEEALRASEGLVRAIVDTAADGIVSVQEDGTITAWNPAAERIFGFTAQEALTRSFGSLLLDSEDEAPPPGPPDPLGPLARTPPGTVRGLTALRKDGAVVPVELSIGETRVGDRRILTAIVRDVTERKRTERELARRAEELARTNEYLEQFAHVASHDLQEPLRAVASFTQLLQERYAGRLDDQADEMVGYIVEGVRRMHDLIAALLAFSGVSKGGGPTFTEVDTAQALDKAVANLAIVVHDSGGAITHGPLPRVLGDAAQITQLFQNLVGNALKFRSTEPPRVDVQAHRREDRWVFSVRDNGIGIRPEHIGRIFLLFQRLHHREEYPGTGLGLAICKRIVQNHGGHIWAESQPEEGSTFLFTLPALGSEAEDGLRREAPAAPRA